MGRRAKDRPCRGAGGRRRLATGEFFGFIGRDDLDSVEL